VQPVTGEHRVALIQPGLPLTADDTLPVRSSTQYGKDAGLQERGEDMKTVTCAQLKGLNFAGCGREIEKRMGKLEPIRAVGCQLPFSQTVTITYDDTADDRGAAEEAGRGLWLCLLGSRSSIGTRFLHYRRAGTRRIWNSTPGTGRSLSSRWRGIQRWSTAQPLQTMRWPTWDGWVMI